MQNIILLLWSVLKLPFQRYAKHKSIEKIIKAQKAKFLMLNKSLKFPVKYIKYILYMLSQSTLKDIDDKMILNFVQQSCFLLPCLH